MGQVDITMLQHKNDTDPCSSYNNCRQCSCWEHCLRREGNMFRHYTAQLLDGFGWKMTFSMAGTVIATIQGFYGELLWAFLAMFVLDFMSGIGKSLKNGIPIVSRRLRDSVTKLGGYMLLITALTVITYFDSRWSLVLTSCYWFFIFTEFKSILENAEEMGAKVPKPLIDLVNTKLKEIIKVFTNKSK